MNNISKIFCSEETTLLSVLNIFNKANSNSLPSGIALVLDKDNKLIGTITDGDVRRSLLSSKNLEISAKELMENNPIIFQEHYTIREILEKLPIELAKRKRRTNKYLNKIVIVNHDMIPVRVLDYHELWEQKVASHRHLVIVGMGYVGLTMAVVMADVGFMVTGVEVNHQRFEMLKNGESYIHEVGLTELLKEQINRNLFISQEIPEDGDVFIISVGTPVENHNGDKKIPSMNFLIDACNKIGKILKRGNLVVLRSTVPIGTCRQVVKEKLEENSGLRCGIDFHLSFAPERTAEGKALKELRSLPQIIGGYNNDSLEATAAIFRDLTSTIVKVDSLEAAEMAKLLNNSFRDYIFAFSNQAAQIASKFNINILEVIKAANEGYIRDPIPLPSPGVGGPCLTKDPHIFASVASAFNLKDEVFINSRKINESMHIHVVSEVMKELESIGKLPNKSKILICGLAFKGNPETGDLRNSTSIEIAELFQKKGCEIFGHDVIALKSEIEEYGIIPVNFPEGFSNIDVILFLNNHKYYEKVNIFEMVRALNHNPIVYDGWGFFRHEDILSIKPSTYIGLSYNKSSIKK